MRPSKHLPVEPPPISTPPCTTPRNRSIGASTEISARGDAERAARILARTGSELGEQVWLDGAAPESNRASRGLHDLTGFEDRLGHRARPLRGER